MSDIVPDDHREAIERLARLGYLARALVFSIIGFFAFRTATAGGEAMNEREAIALVFGSPFGLLMLAVLVIALPSFSLWRFLQAIWDADGYGTGWHGIATRIGRFVSGCLYLLLAVYAGTLLFGLSGGGEGDSGLLETWAPVFGPWFTIPLGILMLGVAASHLKKAWTGSFMRFLSLPAAHAGWMIPVCRAGLVARALVFAAFAILFFTSVSRWEPEDTPGIDDALLEIGSWPAGGILLSATGVGLLAFAAYCVLLAVYGHVRAPDVDPSQALRSARAAVR